MGAFLTYINEPRGNQPSQMALPLLAGLGRSDADYLGATEVALRSLAPLRERRFTAWRGHSGKRYVVSVFAAHDETALGFPDAVLIAVSATRQVLAACDSGPFGIEAATTRWRAEMIAAGATEIHVHLLAENGETRSAIISDLMAMMTH